MDSKLPLKRDIKKEYANKLRAIADMIESGQKIPMASRVMIFCNDGTILRVAKDEPQINAFFIVGGLHYETSEAMKKLSNFNETQMPMPPHIMDAN